MTLAWWDSPDRLAVIFRTLTFASLGCALVFGVALFLINDRIGRLQSSVIERQTIRVDDQSSQIQIQSGRIQSQSAKIDFLNSEADRLQKIAQELTVKARNAERGVSDIYDFQGNRRQQAGGKLSVTRGGPSVEGFQKMSRLRTEGQWDDLKREAEEQMKMTPAWLTPNLFYGVALANLGDLDGARVTLMGLSRLVGDDPAYSMVSGILAEVEVAISKRVP